MRQMRTIEIHLKDGTVEHFATENMWEFGQAIDWLGKNPDVLGSNSDPKHLPPGDASIDTNELSETYKKALVDAAGRGWSFKWHDETRQRGFVPITTYLVDASKPSIKGTLLLTGRQWFRNGAAQDVLRKVEEIDRPQGCDTEPT